MGFKIMIVSAGTTIGNLTTVSWYQTDVTIFINVI